MIKPYEPNWRPPADEPLYVATDIDSLRTAEPVPEISSNTAAIATDFRSLKDQAYSQRAPVVRRTWTDLILDAVTPLCIFIMVYSVIFFLLDVRFIYTETHDFNLRLVAFFFLMGVVALNRLIAREGSQESMIYMVALAGAIGFYTFTTTGAYEVGSVARNFLNDSPILATALNMTVVAFLWWLVNRLTHECCVDENRSAGEIGILTGTARSLRQSFARAEKKPQATQKLRRRAPTYDDMVPMNVIEAFDPTEARQKPAAESTAPDRDTGDRLSRRHPGISIFYFSVPVMLIFAVGLPVVQRGGEAWVRAGEFYMGVYTVSALMLLMLTSLSGLREYFRARRVAMPAMIGVFWIAIGIVQIAIVLVAAARLPRPEMPPPAHIDEHQTDFWTRGSTFELSPMAATPVQVLEQTQFTERVGNVVLIVLALFLTYAAIRTLGDIAARIARRRDRFPRWVVAFFDWLDRILLRLSRLPKVRPRRKRIRLSKDIALSAKYDSSLAAPDAERAGVRSHIGHAYAALCALAADLGVPREEGETPLEFIRRFPDELRALREEAQDLTELYVMSAYSDVAIDPRALDRLRRFWIVYNRVRARHVR